MIAYDENGVNSYYNGLAVQANKQFTHGLQAMLSYTWSHEIDDGQSYGESQNNLFLGNPWYWLWNGNYKADKGTGTEDQRHRLVLSWVWAPRFTHASGAIARYLINGWQLSSITSMASGHPYGSETITTKDTPVAGMFNNYSLNGIDFSTRVPWLPVNSYMYPAMYRQDANLTKVVPFGEGDRYKLSLRFDVFNVPNTWAARDYTSSQAYTEAKGRAHAHASRICTFPAAMPSRRMAPKPAACRLASASRSRPVGRTPSSAAGPLAGFLVLRPKSGTRASRADQGVRPTHGRLTSDILTSSQGPNGWTRWGSQIPSAVT